MRGVSGQRQPWDVWSTAGVNAAKNRFILTSVPIQWPDIRSPVTPTTSLRPNPRSRAFWLRRWLVIGLLARMTICCLLVPEVLADTSRTKADLEALAKARVAALTTAQQPLIMLADKYRAALQKQKEVVQAAGDLDAVLAVDAALAELNAGVEAAEPPQDANVSRLRAIYLRERKALALRLQPEIARVESDHLSRLEKLMADLTKLGLIEEAKMVKKIRDEVAEDLKTRKPTDMPTPITGEPKPGAVRASDLLKSVTKFPMCWVPSGEFLMGSPETEAGRKPDEVQHKVTTSGFWMAQTEVTKAQWDQVRKWGLKKGYDDLPDGTAPGPDHPVASVSWHAAVKWCNARSEMEDLKPCYFTDAAHTMVYRTGEVDLSNDMVLWDANGYRLTTKAEWEKAARGGLSGKAYPWGDTITKSLANYAPASSTSKVSSFAPNGYGLYDIAGNVWEWCWDWHGAYSSEVTTDPRGPFSGPARVVRGGSGETLAIACRVAGRCCGVESGGDDGFGFRPARGQ
jgi:formylglycine-generating enzyme required for sulfatase activity